MATQTGTPGGDVLGPGTTGNTNDSFSGVGGNDTLYGGSNNDSLYGGDDNDLLYGGAQNDRLYGGNGDDVLFGEADRDSLVGDFGNDTLYGGGDTDTISGGDGDDYIFEDGTDNGSDSIFGGLGTDTVDYSLYNDSINASLATGIVNPSGAGNNDTLSSIEVLIGSAFGDEITGSTGNDGLFGGGGNDTINGGDGDDTVGGGIGDDSLTGGAGNDTADFSNASANLTINLTSGSATGQGTDILNGFENAIGGSGNDTITGTTGDNLLASGAGDDSVSAGSGNDSVTAGTGNDRVDAGIGNDTIDGGAGNDVLRGGSGDDSVSGGDGADTIYAGSGSDTVDGGSGSDLIYGGSSATTSATFILNGTFTGGGTGWTGTDLEFNPESSYFTGGSSNGVSEIDGNSGQTTVMNQSFTVGEALSAQLTFRGIVRRDGTVGVDGYRVEILDASGNVILTQTILPGSNALPNWTNYSFDLDFPAAGTYTLRFTEIGNGDSLGALVDDVQITSTLDTADVLTGGDGNDTLYGGAGSDVISGNADDDLLYGDAGNDTLSGGTGNDALFGGTGDDSLDGGTGNNLLDGGAGNDALTSDLGDDTLYGGTGNDTISAGAGADVVDGGTGDDTILFGEGADTVYGGDGNDLVDDVIGTELAGANLIYGGSGNDSLWSGDGDDTLFGGTGNDDIFGEDGNDFISGGAGADALSGGIGNDTFSVGLGDIDTVSGTEVILGGGVPYTLLPDPTDVDVLDVSAFGIAYGWSQVVIDYTGGDPTSESGTIRLYADVAQTILLGTINFDNIEVIIPCFTPGTRIETDRGLVPVEALAPGDLVLTRDHGLQPLRWVGRRQLSYLDLLANPDLQPVRIGRDAVDGIGPDRSMLVSPQHRLLIEGAAAELLFGEAEVLVAAKHLLGRAEVTRALPTEGVTYIHLLFDRHEIVQSDGIWTESFQPAERMLSAMEAEVRAEVLALFPTLVASAKGYGAARLSLKAHEVQVLLAS